MEHVERARALIARGVGRRLDLPGGVGLTVGYGGAFSLGAAAEPDGPQLPFEAAGLPEEGRLDLIAGWAIEVARGAPPEPRDRWEICLDADAIAGPLLVRRRRPGDRLRLAGGRGSKRLQDLFVDAKVPQALRDAWPVVATPERIVWVAGLRAAEGCLATAASRKIIKLRVSRGILVE
jgi:tRNA(Ile)-lysidine synthetase-like protein